ncbi:hypothetical protein VNO77_25266 [Canavalia gladiata]|uniref:Uncharacterized protein n=1 Tax=Canavalia gladiata TaxID=3824 RepID=A0AAN9QAR7_CANGL
MSVTKEEEQQTQLVGRKEPAHRSLLQSDALYQCASKRAGMPEGASLDDRKTPLIGGLIGYDDTLWAGSVVTPLHAPLHDYLKHYRGYVLEFNEY